jgi:hypothetical protein
MINAAAACTTVGDGITWPDVAMGVVVGAVIGLYLWLMMRDG